MGNDDMIQMKIAFVLRLVDDFSGQCVQRKKFRFSIGNNVVHPIEKPEGLYVFLEPLESDIRVFIEGSDYYPCSVLVQKQNLSKEEPIAEVRLYGKIGKGFPYSCEFVTGVLKDMSGDTPVEVFARRTNPTGLLFKEYKEINGQHLVRFQGFTKEKLLGKPYVLGDGKDAVPFILMEKLGVGEYRIELNGAFPIQIEKGASLHRIYRSVTDEKGTYAIPVDIGEEQKIKEVMLLQYNDARVK